MNGTNTSNEKSGKKTHAAITEGGSPLSRYQEVIVGSSSVLKTLYFELCMWLAPIPGALGLVLRKLFWPRMFGACGKGVMFAPNVILRHPHRISLGDHVVISEKTILDARNQTSDKVLIIDDDVMISNDVSLTCKNGTIHIHARTGIGAQTIIQSINGCAVEIGEDVIIGPGCYIVGGGNYKTERLDIPMCKQGMHKDSGVRVENDVWLGAKVTVLGGVVMGTHSIAAAGAVVTKAVPEKAICAGIPAKVIKKRG